MRPSEKYGVFMRHAKKLTNSRVVKDHHRRDVLEGVKHFDDGRLAVTDGHRLYHLKDVDHGKGDNLITPSGRLIKKKGYPDVMRLMPDSTPDQEMYLAVKELFIGADGSALAGKVAGVTPSMTFKGNHLSFVSDQITFKHELSKTFEGDEFYSNAQYWVDALNLFKALGYDQVCLKTFGRVRPFLLGSLDRKLEVIILPIRRL
ncbi:hypothetical protein KQI76_06935 [Amphibacillus sp. MSJ-3]|uniref:hypothetical protein n=1 Tax=Amphibacillus sp. MSJ-3 TaxID=2841505 RepID=UPI001C0F110E|nr:hypothetical protein [Amphibacillus sp. MSJ-3]MBU5594896.1 hypothetical protein [Amphibacillus sp. MSJ-3]